MLFLCQVLFMAVRKSQGQTNQNKIFHAWFKHIIFCVEKYVFRVCTFSITTPTHSWGNQKATTKCKCMCLWVSWPLFLQDDIPVFQSLNQTKWWRPLKKTVINLTFLRGQQNSFNINVCQLKLANDSNLIQN